MNRTLLVAVALLASTAAAAENVASTIHGGIGAAWREPGGDPLYDQLEYDTGTALFLDVASHYEYGLLMRVTYTYTLYDALTAFDTLVIGKDFEQHDARAGLFYAPWTRGPVGYRIGGGYAWAHEDVDVDEPDDSRTQAGGFVEAGLTARVARWLTLDFAAAGLKWEGDGDYDAEGAEARVAAVIHTRPLDIIVGGRYLRLERESPFDEELYELRIGIGGAWGYPEN
jgi:hypothetical protein